HFLGLGARLAPELAAEDLGALLIAAQRGVGAALVELQTHERAVDDFLRRIEREEPPGGLDRALPPAGPDLRRQQLAEDADADAPVAETFGGEPFVVAFDGADEAFEEVAAV